MGLGKWESFLSDHIEGFFNKRFDSDLEPVELMNGMEKEMQRQADGKADCALTNAFRFSLSAEDYHRLCSKRVIEELCLTAMRQVIVLDGVMEGDLSVHMEENEALTRGRFRLQATMGGTVPQKDDTLVLERTELTRDMPLNLPLDRQVASLTVIEGPDADAYLAIGEHPVYIGRRDKNEFILTDANASRLHAWISYEAHRHELHDAKSTNGTFVNGRRITSCRLRAGDRIRTGETIFVYEVI
ncbi:FhaA domain-containing protein [Mitsuokella sp. oral taxon 131]|uniref:FhaA domain-containing protein n=1 Tax=Mitsuokella sp. oral taxon 131 TaxID=1321780 RepID=UPI0003AE1A69|nr:FhaA domain-containing protein [Mitsuokella sp. oral taxon 131]ERL03214.1 FHA domain protein [Mitsuokella sp. oral taxon 131 str. W9106]